MEDWRMTTNNTNDNFIRYINYHKERKYDESTRDYYEVFNIDKDSELISINIIITSNSY